MTDTPTDLGERLRALAPARGHLVDTVAAAIADGTYPPGSRMPSVTALASALGIADETARRVYHRLAARGLVEVRPRVGVFVAEDAAPVAAGPGWTLDDVAAILDRAAADLRDLARRAP